MNDINQDGILSTLENSVITAIIENCIWEIQLQVEFTTYRKLAITKTKNQNNNKLKNTIGRISSYIFFFQFARHHQAKYKQPPPIRPESLVLFTNIMSLTTKDKNDDSSITTTNYADNPNLSPIEQKILQQYQLMNNNLLKISNELELLTNTTDEFGKGKGSSIQLVENLRQLETKLVFVYTFFKGAVYSILNAQDYIAEQETNGLGGINEGTNEEEEEDDESGNVELLGVSADEN